MTDQENGPDHTVDPRKQEEGSGGYPESNPEGADGAGGGDEDARQGDVDAPSPSTGKEADRGASTGNPDAAG
jgi:hypothetical protein